MSLPCVNARFSETVSDDLDHYRAQPGNWNVQATQLGRGRFNSSIRCLQFPGLIVYDNHWGCGVRVSGESPAGWLMLGASLAPSDAPIQWCGRRIGQGRFACAGERQAIDFNVQDHASDLVMLIAPELLRRVIGVEAAHGVSLARHLGLGKAGLEMANEALVTINHCQSLPHLLDQPIVVARIYASLLRSLEDCFAQGNALTETKKHQRDSVVQSAIARISEVGMATSAWDMAQAAGVSQKTLELAFREVMGITPGKYLILVRLNGVHHQLADPLNAPLTIADIANAWGFSHMGRFVHAYRDLFTELPSETRKKLL
jgi:AraC-like DNA-binding protein